MDVFFFVLSGDFGYVVFVMIFLVFMFMWMGGKVGGVRKKVGLKFVICVFKFGFKFSLFYFIFCVVYVWILLFDNV